MTSVFPAQTPRKRSKNDLKQIQEQQQKIGAMVHNFYERTRTKLVKSLTKCQNRNTLLCRELFQSLCMHPHQELYETIRLHDVIFNQIDTITQTITDFLRKMDGLHQKLRSELTLQQQRSSAKRQKGALGENSIAVLRKVSFKREKHALKHRLVALDTINKKVMKCEAEREAVGNGFHFDIEGRKAEPLILAYSKIWFQSKRREYLLCLGSQGKLHIFNDKLQTISVFSSPVNPLNPPLSFVQLEHYLYFVTPHQITRISLLNQLQTISNSFRSRILRAQTYMGGVLLWAIDGDRQHRLLFLDAELQVYCMSDLKMNVSCIVSHFTLQETVYFLTATQNAITEILKIDQFQAIFVAEVPPVEEVIPVTNGNKTQEVIFRLSGNKFLKFSSGGNLVGLQVQIEQGQPIRSCAILGEHFYALSENGKSMLECHYPVSPSP